MKAFAPVAALLAAWTLAACAAPRVSPATDQAKPYYAANLKLRLSLPPGWRAEWVTAPTAMLMVRAADGASKATVTLDPTASTIAKPLAEAREYVERKGATGRLQDLEGTVSGHKAVGFRLETREGTFTVFAIDHDRGIYVLIMSCRTPEGQAQLDDLFARMAIDEAK
jgi:hypothetical protein